MNLYGKVVESRKNGDGIWFSRVEDLNNSSEPVTLCSGASQLKVGQRFSCNTEKVGRILHPTTNFKFYEDKEAKIHLGNAVNVAGIMYNQSASLVQKEAPVILEVCGKARKEMGAEYPDIKDLDIKMSEAFKHIAATEFEGYGEFVEESKNWVRMHIDLEEELL